MHRIQRSDKLTDLGDDGIEIVHYVIVSALGIGLLRDGQILIHLLRIIYPENGKHHNAVWYKILRQKIAHRPGSHVVAFMRGGIREQDHVARSARSPLHLRGLSHGFHLIFWTVSTTTDAVFSQLYAIDHVHDLSVICVELVSIVNMHDIAEDHETDAVIHTFAL